MSLKKKNHSPEKRFKKVESAQEYVISLMNKKKIEFAQDNKDL